MLSYWMRTASATDSVCSDGVMTMVLPVLQPLHGSGRCSAGRVASIATTVNCTVCRMRTEWL